MWIRLICYAYYKKRLTLFSNTLFLKLAFFVLLLAHHHQNIVAVQFWTRFDYNITLVSWLCALLPLQQMFYSSSISCCCLYSVYTFFSLITRANFCKQWLFLYTSYCCLGWYGICTRRRKEIYLVVGNSWVSWICFRYLTKEEFIVNIFGGLFTTLNVVAMSTSNSSLKLRMWPRLFPLDIISNPIFASCSREIMEHRNILRAGAGDPFTK